MQEDFLHHVWKYKKFELFNLKSTSSKNIEILSFGQHNLNSGPDFFNAKISIDNQVWAGNVEIHLKSSDWYLHNHETDSNYDNVILHVVWEDDAQIFRKDNSVIPTLELKHYILPQTIANYNSLLLRKQNWINCEKDIHEIDAFVLQNWIERLYFERLERKSNEIFKIVEDCNNNWEEVLFKLLSKNFGLKLNGSSFLSVANSVDYSVVRKEQTKLVKLEALLFGQANLLNDSNIQDKYYLQLQKEYDFLTKKYSLKNEGVIPLQFFRLRPPNFPTIRLAQLAQLLNNQHNLFSKLIALKSVNEFYSIFEVSTSEYWETHYTFGKVSKKRIKNLSKSFIDLLLINTIIPLIFTYSKHQGKDEGEKLLKLIQEIDSEKNSIIDNFKTIRIQSKSALQSQALLQLYTEYCSKNKCLQCAIGSVLLNRNM